MPVRLNRRGEQFALSCFARSEYHIKKGGIIADTICHGVQGGLLVAVLIQKWMRRKAALWILVIAGVLFGTLPDIIGAYGNLIEHDHWALYRRAHFGDIKDLLQYIPMYWMHLQFDGIMHGPGHRWWKVDERLWLEIVLWLINLLVIAWLMNSWKKRASSVGRPDADVPASAQT